MKLSDWAKKQGIAYLTAYRWFKDNKLPVQAYQSESGTIIVNDDADNPSEQQMAGNSNTNNNNDVMSLFLKKTVEFSKNNATVEDFAAYVISTFTLKFNNASPEGPKYSKNKPKPEDVRKHFDQFLKPKGEKPKPAMFVAEGPELDKIFEASDENEKTSFSTVEAQNSSRLYNDLSAALNKADFSKNVLVTSDSTAVTNGVTASTDGLFARSFETPHNYTNSTTSTISAYVAPSTQFPAKTTSAFVPTEKELRLGYVAEEKPKARRGRKPSIKGQ